MNAGSQCVVFFFFFKNMETLQSVKEMAEEDPGRIKSIRFLVRAVISSDHDFVAINYH